MIRRVVSRMSGPGLGGNIGAQGTSQAVNMVVQLVSVPILATNWGLETYGVWLILFSIPYYLAMSDLGLIGAAANDIAAAAAQDRRADALRTMQAVQSGVTLIGIAVVAVCAVVLLWPGSNLLAFAQAAAGGEAIATVLVIVAWGVLGQQFAIARAGLRAGGYYPTAIYLITAATAIETLALWGWVLTGGGLLGAALCYLVGHAIILAVMRIAIARKVPWLSQWRWRVKTPELRRLIRPALAMMLIPLCYALSMQGMILAIGAAAGAAAVPYFTSVRTLTRAAVQVTGVINIASMPEFTVAHARGDVAKREELVALSIMTGLIVLLPAAVVLFAAGPWLVALWTGGEIVPGYLLVAMLTAAMVLNGLWVPISNLMMAANEHERFSYVFAGLATVSVLMAFVLSRRMGPEGAALAAMCFDAAMLGWVGFQAWRMDLLHAAALRRAPGRVKAMLVRFLGRG